MKKFLSGKLYSDVNLSAENPITKPLFLSPYSFHCHEISFSVVNDVEKAFCKLHLKILSKRAILYRSCGVYC